jgi:peroxiredoxin
VFYRGGWCPYCNISLRAYQAQLVPALADRGVSLVAVSPQAPDGSLSTKETKELTFTVLSDPGNQIARQLGILTAPSDGARAAQLELGLDLTQVNADGTTRLPMPTVLIADVGGVIRWIDVHPDYTTRTEPGQVLEAVSQTIPA